MRKKEKFEKTKKFIIRIKEVYKETEAALKKNQEETKKYTNKKRNEVEEYQIEDWVLLSTKDLKYKMKERQSEKLTKQFIKPYQVKGIISTNAIELDLPSTVKIHPVVNVSKVHRYKNQVKGQKKERLAPVIIEAEEEYEVEKILNEKKFRGKDRYLVQQKGYIAKENTQELRENLENIENLVKEFKEEYGKIRRMRKKRNNKKNRKGELPDSYMAKILYK